MSGDNGNDITAVSSDTVKSLNCMKVYIIGTFLQVDTIILLILCQSLPFVMVKAAYMLRTSQPRQDRHDYSVYHCYNTFGSK